jgi:peroxiredoxin
MPTTLRSGDALPEMVLPCAGGGSVRIGGGRGGWQLVVFYRGRHCPICNGYLQKLQSLLPRFAELDAEVVAVSADTAAQANASLADWRLKVILAYGLTLEQMRAFGLFISEGSGNESVGHPYPEPALFLVNPDGRCHIIEIANAPFVRADLDAIANGLAFIKSKNYPIRGELG